MSVKLTEVRAIRIICDDDLKDRMFEHLTRFGATGYTWWLAHGKGEHRTGAGIWNEWMRAYIEVWCTVEVAEKILAYCQSSQFRDKGMAVGITPLLISEEEAAKFTAK